MIVDDIKNNLKIVNLAESEGLEVRKQGKTYVSKCCFHTETNSSLTFYPETNTFKCFGCGEHGDSINFYSLRKGLDNAAAIKALARTLNLKNSVKQPTARLKNDRRKTQVIDLNQAQPILDENRAILEPITHKIFSQLKDFCNGLDNEALKYLTGPERGLTENTIKRFGLFSIKDYDATKAFLLSIAPLSDLRKAGLFSANSTRFGFQLNKVIIPIIENGQIIALHGRYLYKGSSKPPKTKTYQSSRYKSTSNVKNRLFNGDILKTLKKGERVFLAEGEFDTMIINQNGKNAVGLLGVTNYDKDTIKRLNGFDLILALDNDAASEAHTSSIAKIFQNQTSTIPKKQAFAKGIKDATEYYLAINKMQFVV